MSPRVPLDRLGDVLDQRSVLFLGGSDRGIDAFRVEVERGPFEVLVLLAGPRLHAHRVGRVVRFADPGERDAVQVHQVIADRLYDLLARLRLHDRPDYRPDLLVDLVRSLELLGARLRPVLLGLQRLRPLDAIERRLRRRGQHLREVESRPVERVVAFVRRQQDAVLAERDRE